MSGIEWANIRIHEPVRDDARDLPQTYTEVMQAGIDALEGREPTGDVDVSAIVSELKDEVSMAADPTVQPDVDALMDKLDRIERAATTAEERTNAIAKELEDMRR